MASNKAQPSFQWPSGSPLETFLLEGIRCLGLDPDDQISRTSVTHALDQLIALDPNRASLWFLRGYAGEPTGALALDASRHEHFDHYVVGLLAGVVERGDTDALAEALDEHHDAAMRVFTRQLEPQVTAPTLLALLTVRPTEAAALAHTAPRDYPGATEVLDAFRQEARSADRRGESDTAAILARVARELEETAPPTPGGDADD